MRDRGRLRYLDLLIARLYCLLSSIFHTEDFFKNVVLFHREADMTKERIEKLLKAGANVILTTKGIDDMALKVRSKTNKSLSTQRFSS